MSLENELALFQADLKCSEEKLAKFMSLDTNKMDEMQLQSYNRGIRFVKEDISELKELIAEVKAEMEE